MWPLGKITRLWVSKYVHTCTREYLSVPISQLLTKRVIMLTTLPQCVAQEWNSDQLEEATYNIILAV